LMEDMFPENLPMVEMENKTVIDWA